MQKLIIYLTLLIEVLGISIIIPAFPELKLYYGVGEFEITLGLAIYSLFAFIAAPILGQWSDKIGRKKSLALCVAGTTLSYFILLIQPRYRIFLLSRIVNGFTGGNISIIQAVLTDISATPAEKNKNFGLMGAVFGLGFIIGPVVGSLLLQIGGVEAIFRGGGLLALVQFSFFMLGFHNTNTASAHHIVQYNPLKTLSKYLNRADLRPWLMSMLILGVAVFIVNATQSLYMANEFATPGTRYGYYLAILGVVIAFNMAFMVPKVWTKYFSNIILIRISLVVGIVGNIIVSMIHSELAYILSYIVVAFFVGIYTVLYTTTIMSHARSGETGEMSGMFSSIQSLTMIIGPVVGGALLHTAINIHRGTALLFILSAMIMWPIIGVKKNNHVS